MPSTCLVAELLSRIRSEVISRYLWSHLTVATLHPTFPCYVCIRSQFSNLFLLTRSPHLRSKICRPLLVSPWRKVHDLNRWMSLTHTHTFHLLRDGFVESELLIGLKSSPSSLATINSSIFPITRQCDMHDASFPDTFPIHEPGQAVEMKLGVGFHQHQYVIFHSTLSFFIDCCLSLAFHDSSSCQGLASYVLSGLCCQFPKISCIFLFVRQTTERLVIRPGPASKRTQLANRNHGSQYRVQ